MIYYQHLWYPVEILKQLYKEYFMPLPKKHVWVSFQKEGIHCYPDAPDEVSFLKHPHRHIFHFKVQIEVYHDDRDIEFIMFKRELESLYETGALQLNHQSCEMMADELSKYIYNKYPERALTVEVNEDNENGAIIVWTY